MDDLVKRLRSKNCCDATKCNCDEAADRIEQLEAALREISNLDGYIDDGKQFHFGYFGNIARTALGEKKDD